NHTILPEALEQWPVDMMAALLPRHMQLIYEINARFLRQVATRHPMDTSVLGRMSIINDQAQTVRMANLATVGASSINGVAKIHTDLLKSTVLSDFADFWPEKFNNKTNGVTQRRWLLKANPRLADVITERIGSGWVTELSQLEGLVPYADDSEFRAQFREAKQHNKVTLAKLIEDEVGVAVPPEAMFDVQVKRLHEYKRQLLLALYTIVRYNRLKDNPDGDHVPRTFIFSGKAAPGFAMAKLLIKLIHQIGEVVNADPQVKDLMQVIFLPNYRVSLAERIIPAANLSEQISLAGTEASGTGNMKLQLNGALTIGTLDGANVEILEEVGPDNIFIFGMTTEQVAARRASYNPWDNYWADEEVRRALQMVEADFFSMVEPGVLRPILDALLRGGDHYMVLGDLRAYIDAQDSVDALYRNPDEWDRKAILNVANAGLFSSDRTIAEYARDIWRVEPCEVP
ncbi:MAG: glycogen/starch/alpha-glucan family phosphorylase, partial [Armatimonadota bacterium]